jgi:hypothetical protein
MNPSSRSVIPADDPCALLINSNSKNLEDPDDLTPLTDATFVANTLGSLSPQQKQQGAGTGWRGIGSKVEVAVLQRGVAEVIQS